MRSGINELRRELLGICAMVESRRPPAIRRSLLGHFLYAVDIPQAADVSAVAHFAELARAAGWIVEADGNWLQMDKTVIHPPGVWFSGMKGPEVSCCLSILKRHSGWLVPSDGIAERRLIKAAEVGQEAYEDACRKLHEEWAERLRTGSGIPRIHPVYFEGGEIIC